MEWEKTLALLVSVTILGSQNGVIWKNIFFRFRCVKLKSDHLRKHDFNWRFVVENCHLFSVKLLIQKCVTCEHPSLPLQFMKPGKAKASVASIYQMAYQDLRRLEAVCSDFQRFCATCQHLERKWGANSAFGVGDLNFTSHFREIPLYYPTKC